MQGKANVHSYGVGRADLIMYMYTCTYLLCTYTASAGSIPANARDCLLMVYSST
jgi:hypothetical protein